MRSYFAAGVVLLGVLTGCSYHYDLKAVEMDGTIAFVPKADRGTGCFSDFRVETEAREVVWALDAGQYLPPPCDNKFPIRYGSVPHGMVEKVKAKPLKAGMLYRLQGWDGDSYAGAFRFRQGIVVGNADERR